MNSAPRHAGFPSSDSGTPTSARPAVSSRRDDLAAVLTASRNSDGGWGYRAGKRSRLEATSFGLLALAAGGGTVDARVLARWERANGLLVDPNATHANVAFNAVAALAAQYRPLGLTDLAAVLIEILLDRRGAKLDRSDAIGLDTGLVGWPWVDGTFSWVEPTSWCLVALKHWARTRPSLEGSTRIDEAERLLRDRVCGEGGWNYGNPKVLGQSLQPYAATSALALIALQKADDPIVRKSAAALRTLCTSERSGFALALSALAFRLLGQEAPEVELALWTLWDATRFGGETVATALALYLLTGAADGYEAFRV